MAKILILGGSGLLGPHLNNALNSVGNDVIAVGHKGSADVQADLTVEGAATALMQKHAPDVIINCVGLTNVDLCQIDPNHAFHLNVGLVEKLATAIKKMQSAPALIHISTDHVYDADGENKEKAVIIRNAYALSKYAGELAAARIDATILRTNFFGKSLTASRQSFTDWLAINLSGRKSISLFTDVTFSPLALPTIAKIIAQIAKNPRPGTFNLGAHQGMSKADFGLHFAKVIGADTDSVTMIKQEKAQGGRAPRPKEMCMHVGKFEETFGLQLPNLRDQIEIMRDFY